jgi:threonine dehydratase
VRIDTPSTIADGAQTQALGEHTFPIIARVVADILDVSDVALAQGMRMIHQAMQLVVEPTGCLGFAGACSMQAKLRGKRVGVLLSGGNIDAVRFAELVT